MALVCAMVGFRSPLLACLMSGGTLGSTGCCQWFFEPLFDENNIFFALLGDSASVICTWLIYPRQVGYAGCHHQLNSLGWERLLALLTTFPFWGMQGCCQVSISLFGEILDVCCTLQCEVLIQLDEVITVF